MPADVLLPNPASPWPKHARPSPPQVHATPQESITMECSEPHAICTATRTSLLLDKDCSPRREHTTVRAERYSVGLPHRQRHASERVLLGVSRCCHATNACDTDTSQRLGHSIAVQRMQPPDPWSPASRCRLLEPLTRDGSSQVSRVRFVAEFEQLDWHPRRLQHLRRVHRPSRRLPLVETRSTMCGALRGSFEETQLLAHRICPKQRQGDATAFC